MSNDQLFARRMAEALNRKQKELNDAARLATPAMQTALLQASIAVAYVAYAFLEASESPVTVTVEQISPPPNPVNSGILSNLSPLTAPSPERSVPDAGQQP